MSKNKRCIFVADTQASALGMSHWLESQGVENVLIDKTTLGFSHGISFTSDDPAADGWQIWVKDSDQIATAQQLIAERNSAKEEKSNLGSVVATCEECGQAHEFEGRYRGTIQDCPSCGRYMDVGGIEEQFNWPESFDSDQS